MTPSTAKTQPDGLGQTITRAAVGTVIPVLGLFVLRLILASLPMIKNAGPLGDTGLTPLLLVKVLIDTTIYVLIFRFAWSAAESILAFRPHLAEVAWIVKLAGVALVATLAYSGYEGLILALAREQAETYNWIFLIVVLASIAAIVVVVTRRLDFFTNLVFGQIAVRAHTPAPPAAFAAAASATPPSGPPPSQALSPEVEEARQRIATASTRIAAAKQALAPLRAQGSIPTEMETAATQMDAYLQGARESFSRQELAQTRHFLDWAEYEASRVLAAR